MNFIVYDLEATCWNGHQISETQEIIEIGAVLMNNYGEVEKDFSAFVQPFGRHTAGLKTKISSSNKADNLT